MLMFGLNEALDQLVMVNIVPWCSCVLIGEVSLTVIIV